MRSISTPAREARYSAWMMVGSVSALSLAMMRAGLPARACSASRSIFAMSAWCRLNGACSSLRSFGTRVRPGELQENLVDVLADRFIGGHQAVVGVQARGLGVVVAGAEVAVAAQTPLLAAHDHDQLGMGLEAEHAVHDVRAGLLQLGRELDVRLLVEARTQLDDHGDVLAGLRRFDQRADDRRIAAGAVQSLLDREHLRIARGLLDEIDDRAETLERVMQQHVAGAQGREQVAADAQPLRNARA